MMAILLYILSFNILAVPFIIYTHVKGECNLLLGIFGNAQSFCSYIANPFANLLYLNIAFFVLAILVYMNSLFPHSESYHRTQGKTWVDKKK